jgi:hypothetical protein
MDYLKLYGLILVPFFLIFGAWNMQSGFLGPSNFQQCFLEKMKGLPQNMEGMAAAECQKQFPPAAAPATASAPSPETAKEIHVEYDNCDDGYGSNYSLCVKKVPDGYKLTRIEAVFFQKTIGTTCEALSESDWKQSEHKLAEKSWFQNKYTFLVKKSPDVCMELAFFGVLR